MNVAGGVGLNGFAGLGVMGFGGLSFDRPGTASLSLSHNPSLCVAVRSASHWWKVFMPYVRSGPSLLVRA